MVGSRSIRKNKERSLGKLSKAVSALARPDYWPALARGVVPGLEHGPAFKDREFAAVIDVGANKGQFAVFAQRRWPKAQLVCFEPLPGPRAQLAAVTRGQVEIHAVALGESGGAATMHVASRTDSSSLLPLGEAQERIFLMHEVRQIKVPVERLDVVIKAGTLPRPTLLKIDVQGFEHETLKGAVGMLHSVDAVYVECSFLELYAGQKLADDIQHLLEAEKFKQVGKYNIVKEPHGVALQADLLFERCRYDKD